MTPELMHQTVRNVATVLEKLVDLPRNAKQVLLLGLDMEWEGTGMIHLAISGVEPIPVEKTCNHKVSNHSETSGILRQSHAVLVRKDR